MSKVIASINMTLDGFCDHTAIVPDEEIHQHYADLLRNAGVMLFGRTTYHLMQYWQAVVENPTGNKEMDDFAAVIDHIPKIVFSHTMKNDQAAIGWESARLASQSLEDEILALKQQPGKEILIGSRSLILQLLDLNLIDEFQLCIHPVIAGEGLPLFENLHGKPIFKLLKTKIFSGGAVLVYYERR